MHAHMHGMHAVVVHMGLPTARVRRPPQGGGVEEVFHDRVQNAVPASLFVGRRGTFSDGIYGVRYKTARNITLKVSPADEYNHAVVAAVVCLFVCLLVCLVGWLFGWLAGWLICWLVVSWIGPEANLRAQDNHQSSGGGAHSVKGPEGDG